MGRIDILTGTLGKALGGAAGGYTAARKEIVDWLRQRSRPYLFSNSIPPVIAAATLRVLDLVEAGDELRATAAAQHDALPRTDDRGRLRHRCRASTRSSRSCSATPRSPRASPSALLERRRLRHRLLVPGRAEGQGAHPHADVRGHTIAQLDRAIDAFVAVGRELGVIRQ